MPIIVFLSAVSDEFHKPDPQAPRRFASYRETLADALRRLGPDYAVITQEDLAQGFGDLLETLDDEIRRSGVVVHLVGNLAGAYPEPAPVRRMRGRHPKLLEHEPELAESLRAVEQISYTQWEVYLAFEHRCRRLVYVAQAETPRSPSCAVVTMDEAQTAHLARLKATGEHRERFEDQKDLALKVVTSIARYGIGLKPEPAPAPKILAAARADASGLVHQIAADIRKPAQLIPSWQDPAGVETLLRAIDTAALQRELTRRQALEIVQEHRDELRENVASAPTVADLRELAFAELAMGHYPEAIEAASRGATLAEEAMASEPTLADRHRESALNAYLLLREAAEVAHRHDEALDALRRGCALIDRSRDPILWADYHEELAEFLLDRAEFAEAEEWINEIIDVREDEQAETEALAKSLLNWCRLLIVKAQYSDVIGVARRAEIIFTSVTHLATPAVASALGFRANALYQLGLFADAEPLMRRALAIAERSYGPDHSDGANYLDNLAQLLQSTNRLAEAEPLMARVVSIFETSLGKTHPNVATALSNLARLLQSTNRLAEAEPLMRRALAMAERSHGADHPDVATRLNNLASLLQATNRLAEAEPLMRRALAILVALGRQIGREPPNLQAIGSNYVVILEELGRTPKQIEASLAELLNPAHLEPL